MGLIAQAYALLHSSVTLKPPVNGVEILQEALGHLTQLYGRGGGLTFAPLVLQWCGRAHQFDAGADLVLICFNWLSDVVCSKSDKCQSVRCFFYACDCVCVRVDVFCVCCIYCV